MVLSLSLSRIGVVVVSFRMEICKEIIKDKLHEKPEYFETFMMQIYCFDDPTKQEQVSLCRLGSMCRY